MKIADKAFLLASFIVLVFGQDEVPEPDLEPRQVLEPRISSCASIPNFMAGAAGRIVGGQPADSPIPWQVYLFVENMYSCGGTILDASTILSAAHCFPSSNSPSTIRAGSLNRFNGGQARTVVQNIWNQDLAYKDGNNQNNDWVILKLDSPLNFNENVQPACLPSPNWSPDTDPNARCFVSGWGTLSYEGNAPNTLHWVEIPPVTNDVCKQSYGSTITDSMICGGYPEGGKDSCQGDSGGPFVCQSGNSAILTGVVSFGYECASPGFYGVYARVTKILDWIHANIDGSSPAPSPPSNCVSSAYKGDSYCDDANNNEGCDYDGGDCCGENVKTDFCSACECKDPAMAPCEKQQWQGDSYCDDENNTPGCNYDGGDCCGGSTIYCSVCECKQMAGR